MFIGIFFSLHRVWFVELFLFLLCVEFPGALRHVRVGPLLFWPAAGKHLLSSCLDHSVFLAALSCCQCECCYVRVYNGFWIFMAMVLDIAVELHKSKSHDMFHRCAISISDIANGMMAGILGLLMWQYNARFIHAHASSILPTF
jgi:hypothetical protein